MQRDLRKSVPRTVESESVREFRGLWPELEPADIVETCRDYLLMAAYRGMSPELRVKVAPSDVVQETILAAVQDFHKFQGASERELLAWLTQILAYRIANEVRRFRCEKADVRREVSIEQEVHEIQLSLSGADGTPSALVIAREEEARLHAAIDSLDELDQKLVRLRNWGELTFEAVGASRPIRKWCQKEVGCGCQRVAASA